MVLRVRYHKNLDAFKSTKVNGVPLKIVIGDNSGCIKQFPNN